MKDKIIRRYCIFICIIIIFLSGCSNPFHNNMKTEEPDPNNIIRTASSQYPEWSLHTVYSINDIVQY